MAPEIEPAVARRSRRCNARRLFLERHPPPRTEGRPLVSPGISGVWGRPANLCEMVGVPMAFGMGHGFPQVCSAGIRLLSGVAHCLSINPALGDLIPLSSGCGRSAKNTDSAIIVPAAIIEIACQRIRPICAPDRPFPARNSATIELTTTGGPTAGLAEFTDAGSRPAHGRVRRSGGGPLL
jgi:hypothetical protein